ncbi:ABC transporter permease [Pseudaestuariivita rosea]|uniref:ABC transporter permease n=1 Tax=Pseudaestuariivita rosea TaxID=2763263 RepID=UPI001ABB1D92|nr:ABC transporter permease [Pseudaestuariivita rosea]
MQAIDRKLLRDFKRLWVQALAIALVLACGVTILLTSLGMYQALTETRAAYYERNRFADVFAETRRAPISLMQEIADIDGVLTAEARVSGTAILDLPERPRTATGRILSLPEAHAPVLNIPLLRWGRLPDPNATDEVMVNEPFALANGFEYGDQFSANLNGQKRTLTVVGAALSPEFIYTIGPGALMPDNEYYGILWMSERTVAAAFDMTGAFNGVTLALATGSTEKDVIDRLDDILEPYGGLGAYGRDLHLSDSFIDAEISQLRGMAMVLPPIFFGISAFLVSMVMGRIIALERSEIGLLKAVGYSNTEVCLHYLMLAGLIAVLGICIGWAMGTWLARGMALQYAQFFDFPFVIFRLSYWVYAAAGLAALLTTTLGAMRSALAAAWLAPAIAMQPPTPPRFKRSWLDRMMTALRLSQPTIMILRSFFRWPGRSFLTCLGLSLAVASVIASLFVSDALDEIIETAFFQTNRQDAIVIFTDDLPETALTEVLALPGVLKAEPQQYHTAILRNGYLSKRVAIEARPPNTDLSRVMSADDVVISAPPGGILLSERLADQLDARPGDVIDAEFLTGRRETLALPVTGLVEQHFGLGAYVDLNYINAQFRQIPQMSVANISLDSARLPDLHLALKELPKLSGLVEMNENREAFQETIQQNVAVMNTVYITIAILITIGVAYNGARIQLSERARELASLRILGFGRGEVSYILVGETMFLTLLAQPLGWLIGAYIARLMTNAFSSDLYAIPLVLELDTFALASLIVLTVAFASAMVVRRRLDRLDLVSVMKTRE